jgi:hypothetical protein
MRAWGLMYLAPRADTSRMEFSVSNQLNATVSLAVSALVQNQTRTQGAQLLDMIASSGSVNAPGQGGNLDVRV